MVTYGDLKTAILYVSFVDAGKNELFSPSRVTAVLGNGLPRHGVSWIREELTVVRKSK